MEKKSSEIEIKRKEVQVEQDACKPVEDEAKKLKAEADAIYLNVAVMPFCEKANKDIGDIFPSFIMTVKNYSSVNNAIKTLAKVLCLMFENKPEI